LQTSWSLFSSGAARTFTSATTDGIGVNATSIYIIGSGFTAGDSAVVRNTGTNPIQISAEL
jgi:hypothetical protein